MRARFGGQSSRPHYTVFEDRMFKRWMLIFRTRSLKDLEFREVFALG